MKASVFFFDGDDPTTGDFFSLAQALHEDYVIAEGDEIIPFDYCSIICWYEGKFMLSDWLEITENMVLRKEHYLQDTYRKRMDAVMETCIIHD